MTDNDISAPAPPDDAFWLDTPEAPSATMADAALAQLVATILAGSHPELARALRLAAIPLWFDEALLAALRGAADERTGRILARLGQFSFIQAGGGRYTCNRSVREVLLAGWRAEPAEFVAAHRRALADIEGRLAAVQHEAHPAAYEDLRHARLYHLLVADPPTGMALLHHLFDDARAERRLAAAERYLDLAEEQQPWLPAEKQPYLDYYRALLLQAQNRWASSREQLAVLAARTDLTPDLAARVRRGLGRALVADQDWVAAVAEHKAALAAFETLADRAEVARTMTDLGYAYMDLALRSWGGGESPRLVPIPPLWRLGERLAFPIRLPIVLYLMAQWGAGTLLPAIGRVGRGTDWVIARLLGEAGIWLHRAEKLLQALDDIPGLLAVREHQARVYLALNHPQAAARVYRELLAAEGAALGEYRAARSRLGLAEAILRGGKEPLAEAQTLLTAAQPVFAAVAHAGHAAEAHALLAEACIKQGQPAEALPHYRAAVELWEQAGEQDEQTEVLDQIELLAVQPDLPEATRAELASIAESVPTRRYPVRYMHPLMRAFQLVALICLAGLIFLTPFIAIRTERGAAIGASAPVMNPQQPDEEDEFGPALALSIEQQIRPAFQMRIAGNLIGWAVLAYLGTYLAVGLYLIRCAPLAAIQRGQAADVVLDADGIGCAAAASRPGQRLRWAEITRLVIADRCLISRPIRAFSDTGLIATGGRLVIRGHTRHYGDIQRKARAHLSTTAQVQLMGATILRSKMGALGVLAVGFLAVFSLLARARPDQAITPLPGLPYSLADLYPLAYLGLVVPLGWWFAIQPLRAQLLLRPATPLAWGIGGTGILLAALSLLQHLVWHWPLPRPDIAFPLLAALLVGLAAGHIARASWLPDEAPPGAHHAGGPIYSRPVRYAALAAATVLIGAMLLIAGRELLSFDALVRANAYQRQAEAPGRPKAEKTTLHEQALVRFDRSLALAPAAATHNNRGVTLAQLGRYDEAIASYQAALAAEPQQPIYLGNIGLAQHARANATPLRATYTDQVAGHRISERARVPYYLAALSTYDRLIATLLPDVQANRALLVTAYLMRGGTQYELGDLRLDQQRNADAMASYAAAAESYQWVIEHAVSDADLGAAYTGRGWSRLPLRRQHAKGKVQRLRYLELALDDFIVAARLTPTNASAHSGLGWSHYFIAAENHPLCARGRTAEETRPFRDHIVTSIQAFDTLARLQPTGAVHYRTRAQLNYLLRYCEGYDFTEQLEAAIADYDRALALAPARADWWYTQSGLYLEAQQPEAALASARRSVELDPNIERWLRLATAARRAGQPGQAVEAYEAVVKLDARRFDAWWLLGWSAYEAGDYARSAEASAQAAALDPFEPRVVFNQALAYVAGGQDELARATYELGITVADLLAPKTRAARYAEAISDLTEILADPRDAAPALIELLKEARAKPPADARCRVVYAGADGLNLRSGPGTAYDPPLEALLKNTLVLPLGRNENGTWVKVQVLDTVQLGWLNADARYLTCNLDISTLSVISEPPPGE